ncbi:MAG: hypothetical protein HF978_07320 [Desulfobacteraceae bacterium]|nr:hypothetical protein [Desulfobacteraceae bacterium]MBC2755340.1 hypothetical protein [Desulfobacteraceae bacterium]
MGIINYQKRLAGVFLDKPERVIDFPDWMLSGQQIDAYRQMENPAIVEIAGRDSVAAAIKSVGENGFTDLLPVYAYTGTEYGAWRSVEQAVKRLSARLPKVRIHPLIVVGSPDFWRALNGRYISELISRYNFFSPCPGCHLYLHVIRVPLAKMLGNIPIISGERELHSGQVKINQTGEALDFYLDVAARFNIRLLFPLRYIEQSKEVEDILQIPWERDKDQLECVFSGNYRLCDGSVSPSLKDVNRFFVEFAIPAAEEIVEEYIKGNIPDFMGISRSVLDRNASDLNRNSD